MLLQVTVLLALISCTSTGWPQERPTIPKVGNPASPITLTTWLQAPASARASWETLKGKVVVLEFWATWCGPCVEQIPHLNSLADKFKGKPVQFVSITDEEGQRVESFLRSRPIAGWIGLNPDRSIFKAYGVEGIPETILVDTRGSIAAITDPDQVTETVLAGMLAGEAPKVALATALRGMPEIKREGPESGQPALLDVLIRPSASMSSMQFRPGRLEARGMTLRLALANAYRFPTLRIIAPASFDQAKYDFLLSVPRESESFLDPLFRQVLEATFRLKIRRESREADVLILKVAKGRAAKLGKPASSASSMSAGGGKIVALHSPLSDLTGNIEGTLDVPVLDETGLKDEYDFELSWVPGDPESIKTALVEQLGLELIPARRPVEMLIVEGAEHEAPK